ncbi:MAG: PAS domain S-box protein, partial [Rhodocyclaceae bacterium]
MRFRTKTILGVAAIEMVMLAILVGSALSVLRNSNEVELTRRAQLGGQLLAVAAKDAVISQDLATLDSLVDEAMASGQIDYIRILDARGTVLTERGDAKLMSHTFRPDTQIDQISDGLFDLSSPILVKGVRYGEIRMGISTDPLNVMLASARHWAATIAGLGMLLVALFSWVLGGYLARQLVGLREASYRLMAGDYQHRVKLLGNDELADTAQAFNHLAQQLDESAELVLQENLHRLKAQHKAEKAGSLLCEAISSIAQGFTIYDENDRLMQCNEAYLDFYKTSRDLIVPGNTFEEIVRGGAERGQYAEAIGNVDAWVRQRVAQHQNANGEVSEQRLGDGRWLLIVEYRTPSGYIVGNHIDITELKATTLALAQRELYLRATLDNLPLFFWLKDTGHRFLAVNKIFSNACGRTSPEELVGLTDFDVWPEELAARYRADDIQVMASGTEKTVEEPVAGGSETGWIETYKKPLVAPDGTLLGTVGFARDISERKQMLAALSASEERWQLAISGANDGIWDWNLKTGEVYFSERWKSMLGYSGDEIAATVDEWESRIHPDDRQHTMDELQRHFRGESAYYECEHRLLCKNGEYKWVLDRGKALLDSQGKPVRMSGSHTDISERRAAEQNSLDRTEQLNAVFALGPDGFASFDDAYRVKYVSPAFFVLTGLEEASVIGLGEADLSDLIASRCIPEARFKGIVALRAKQKTGDDGMARGHRQTIELSGAGKRVLEVGLQEASASSVSQILYLHDITHQSEVDRLKSEFLTTAAHELRTPMASIYGFTELLLAQDFDADERRDFLQTIFRQSELMVSIINELLDLARIEARRGKDFKLARIDLNALVREVVSGFKTANARSSPTVSAVAGPLWVRADRSKLTQALNNVISNAYKYSPDGSVVGIELLAPVPDELSVAARHAPRTGIRIVDTGIGMTPEQLARVCERFYRADTSGQIPGTG